MLLKLRRRVAFRGHLNSFDVHIMRLSYSSLFAAATACLLAACAPSTSATTDAAVGSDRDAHGCIPSAGYSWCEHTQGCERPWELASQKGFTSSAQHFARFCSTGNAN
jgi:hypothetical protein